MAAAIVIAAGAIPPVPFPIIVVRAGAESPIPIIVVRVGAEPPIPIIVPTAKPAPTVTLIVIPTLSINIVITVLSIIIVQMTSLLDI